MKQQVHGGDIYRHPEAIDFSSNINPLGTPPSVIDAACESMKQITHYPDIFYTKLRIALECYEKIPAEQLICGNGAADLIFSLVQALKPRKALLPVPTFAEYEQALRAIDCEIDYYMMKEEYQLDRGILNEITPDYDIVFICNPNNPTGFLIEPDFMKEIIDCCGRNQVFLMIDECFMDFIEEPDRYSMKGELDQNRDFFILKAFTKRYAMAGIRLGYGLCSNETLLAKLNQITQPWNVSIPAQAAGVAALKETSYLERARILIRKENAFLQKEMSKMPLKVYDSKANYIFFEGPKDLYDRCLKQDILIRDCSNYPGLGKGFYRIAVKTQEENLQLIQVLWDVL